VDCSRNTYHRNWQNKLCPNSTTSKVSGDRNSDRWTTVAASPGHSLDSMASYSNRGSSVIINSRGSSAVICMDRLIREQAVMLQACKENRICRSINLTSSWRRMILTRLCALAKRLHQATLAAMILIDLSFGFKTNSMSSLTGKQIRKHPRNNTLKYYNLSHVLKDNRVNLCHFLVTCFLSFNIIQYIFRFISKGFWGFGVLGFWV
jgi:hypothetical protein